MHRSRITLYFALLPALQAQNLLPAANSGTPGCIGMFLNSTDLACSAMSQGVFQGNPAVSIGAQTTY